MKNILKKYAMVCAILCSYQAVTAQQITSFTLINAEKDTEIGVLSHGDSIHIPALETDKLNIRADVSGEIGSILFRLDGAIVGAQANEPFALFGSANKDYNIWVPEAKTYNIMGSAYSLPQGQGILLSTYQIVITFTEDDIQVPPIGPTINSLTLINADTDEDISDITEGSVFELSAIGTNNLNIRANASDSTESVVFDYQGQQNYHTENLIEYAIGANDDNDYRPWNADIGANTITATAYTEDNGAGIAGAPYTVNFEIIEAEIDTIPPYILRINSGGEKVVYNDSIFVADTLYVGSSKSYANTNIEDFKETTQDSLYITERTTNGRLQNFGYSIPVPDGDYEVILHFAELYWGATGGGEDGIGKRVFDVAIEGDSVLVAYDMSAEKDAMTAIIKTFNTTVVDGILNIDFGASVDQPKISALEIYELKPVLPDSDCIWNELAAAPTPTNKTNGIKANEKLYVFGTAADTTQATITAIYDPLIDTWETAAAIPVKLSKWSAVAVADEIWVLGGLQHDSISVATNDVLIYNTLTDSWSEGPQLPKATYAAASAYNEGRIHIFGGISGDSLSTSTEHYILNLADSVQVWQPAAALPNPRHNLAAVTMSGKIYALGGENNTDTMAQTYANVAVYDYTLDSWTAQADLPQPRTNFQSSVTVFENNIYIVGGFENETPLNDITTYHSLSNTWSTYCNLPYAMSEITADVFEEQLIITVRTATEGNKTLAIPLESEIEIPVEPKTSVLVFHETAGFRHNSINAGIAMITEFGENLDWKVTASKTSDIFQADSLATYDVVVWLNTTGENLLTPSEETAFEDFIRNGGGFVGIHSATDTYRNGSWPWYNDLVGAIVQVNPYHTANNTSGVIDIVGDHPAIAHLGTTWNKSDEYYYWERNGGYLYEGNIDLLSVQETGSFSYDAARPVTWYKEFDGGRSFYTALGHNGSDYESNEDFKTMIQEAILWAAAEEELPEEEKAEEVIEEEEKSNTDTTANNTIVLFPNPVIDELIIDSEFLTENVTGTVSIFGMDGTLMKQKSIDQNDPKINMSDLVSDYYIVMITIGELLEKHLVFKN